MTLRDLKWQRRNNPKLIAMNMAYGILMDHSPCLADDVPLDGLADDIAKAILRGAIPAETANGEFTAKK